MRTPLRIAVAGAAAAFVLLVGVEPASARDKKAKYLGARACKNCHRAEKKGDQYTKWTKARHADAYKTLKTPEAVEVAAKLGIKEPHKSGKCLKCHVTAYGVEKKRLARKFKHSDGVQCESCHGPAEKHRKARIAAAMKATGGGEGVPDTALTLPPGEIVAKVEEKVCVGCHNPESPSYVEFDFEEFKKKIAHPDPRKEKDRAAD